MRFGVYPGNTFSFGKYAGLVGTNPQATDGDLAVQRAVELANGRPFDIHLYAQWNSPTSLDNADHAIARFTAAGLDVNLALKYVPPAGHDGDTAGFAAWVAGVVRSHPQVRAWQITNEANLKGSPDTDGSATDPIGALVEGVVAAARVKRPRQVVGFNWFSHLDPVSDRQFWSDLGTRGGQPFVDAVDFAGVDIYAGTYIPPVYSVDDEADFRSALAEVRNDLMPLAGLGPQVPIYVQETGYPTLGPLRTEQKQADALAAYIRAARGFNVGLIQWFDLADSNNTVGDGWGLLRADYTPKPAFGVMRDATP